MNIAETAELMLKENTGRHMLDSGGAYGRHWERNQGVSLAEQQAYTAEFSVYGDNQIEIMVTLRLFHWMCHNLEPDDELQALLDKFAEENPNMDVYTLGEEFAEKLVNGEFEDEATGGEWSYPSRGRFGETKFNSYNDDNILSQDILYTPLCDNTWSRHDTTHLVLQVHGGCDARGGHTMPRVFKLASDDYDWLDTMVSYDIYVNGIEPDTAQAMLPGIAPSDHWLGQNTWWVRGQDVDAGDANDCPHDIHKLPAQELGLTEEPVARDEWWIAVVPIEGKQYDKRAYLMPPGIGELHEGLEILAGGQC